MENQECIFNLNRFLEAQDLNGVYDGAIKEIESGLKMSHWIWFVFPQLKGLGRSSRSMYYGISGLEEAKAYLDNEELREGLLLASTKLLDAHDKYRDLQKVLGYIDNMKVLSCMTLFNEVCPNGVFSDVFKRCYNDRQDHRTLRMIGE